LNKQQFLSELRNCLEGEVSEQTIYDNITYYDQYFNEQINMGKTESEIVQELGKPALLAKSIIDASEVSENTYYDEQVFTEREDGSVDEDEHMHVVEIKWYHKLLIAVIIIVIIFLLLTITGAILSIAGPIILILLIIYFIRRFLL